MTTAFCVLPLLPLVERQANPGADVPRAGCLCRIHPRFVQPDRNRPGGFFRVQARPAGSGSRATEVTGHVVSLSRPSR